MNVPFRIEQRESFRVIGYCLHTTNKRKKGRKEIPLLWNEFKEKDFQSTLMPMMNQEPFGLFGISVYNTYEDDSHKFDYYIAVSSHMTIDNELDSYIVPAMTWAVFPCTIETMGKTEVQAITKWLPKSRYKPLNSGYITGRMKSGAPDIQYYGQDGIVEIWIGVTEK